MKEFKGTKGPWRVSEKVGDFIHIRHDNNYPGAMSLNLAHITARASWSKEAEANARLIAAAPEMLAALQRMVPLYESLLTDCGLAHKDMIDDARAAITKALGETK